MKTNIFHKLIIAFVGLLICTLTFFGTIYLFIQKQKNDATLVDVAGRNRMLSQRIMAMAQHIRYNDDKTVLLSKSELKDAIDLHALSIDAILKGGKAPGLQENIVFQPAKGEVKLLAQELKDLFRKHYHFASLIITEEKYKYKKTLDEADKEYLNPVFEKAFNDLKEGFINNTLLAKNKALTQTIVLQAEKTKAAFILILGILLFINLMALSITFFFLKKALAPLPKLSKNLRLMAKGQIPKKLNIKRNDEIGEINQAMVVLGQNLDMAGAFARQIGEGNFNTNITVFNHNGELANSLYAMKVNLQKVAEEATQRQWTSEGLAMFSALIQENKDLDSLSDHFICQLVKYLNANQAALYLKEEDSLHQVRLRMAACYAFERKKHLNTTILPGEGLAGTAYREGETIYVTEIPQGYTTITSGLGGSTPTNIAIVPLKTNNEVEGIIEIASFSKIRPHEIALIEKLAESLGSAVATLKINQITQALLSETQSQTEELRAQEEELRQNMEELHATQEQLRRRDIEMQNELTALRKKYQHQIEEIEQSKKTLLDQKALLTQALTIDNTLIDLAGRNRMLSQKIGFLCEMVYNGKTQFTEELAKTIKLHDVSLKTIKFGGIPPQMKTNYELPPVDVKLIPQILEVENLWREFKNNAELILESALVLQEGDPAALSEAINFIEDYGNEMLKRNNELVEKCKEVSREKLTILGFE
jgi:GAF domain-containing protein